jgi:photosystem II stability/assembly factor-like uncharacterized protein
MRSFFRVIRVSFVCAVVAAAAIPCSAEEGVNITSYTFGALQARALGPATMSGRIMAIDAVPGDPLVLWVGAASGGVWKSKDGGTTFRSVFDEHTQSIGALRIDPTDPEKVWVGTGESCTRNSVSIGDGVYKTTDGGDSWSRMGLEATERIAKIEIHPSETDTVFVCATGHLWNANAERGVYRTDDGGETWKKVLYVDDDTGCSDLAMDPQEPRILYAGMWQFRRSPDFFTSGGPGSGIYKSTDGGESWTRLSTGLPEVELGRIGIAVAPSRPTTVYALVEARGDKPEKPATAIYRSDDAGATWERMNDSFNVQVRPFYFAHVVVDPTDHNRVYKPGLTLTQSTDGGKSFTSPFTGGFGGGPHSDHHALWIDPRNPLRLFLGTDGGLHMSNNRGGTWVLARNLPIGQFYKISVDGQDPYRIFGGMQDNSSWVGPSESWGGVENKDWTNLSGGDGFATFADAREPRFIYTTIQGGVATRVNLESGESKDIKPFAKTGEDELRFNWNTPFVLSPNDPATIYIGAQFLLRSRDRGESWERISPDLTTNDPQRQRQKESGGISIDNSTAENNATLYTIAESPRNPEVIWVGTDDGNVQLTRDGGKTWSNLIQKIPDAPMGAWVSRIEASRTGEGTAYVLIDDHRRGDMRPHVWRTRDFGETWESLVTEELEGYAWVLVEDPVNPDLLFLGTEWGLWISLDAGEQWARFEGGIPARVSVQDLVVHPREGDLIVGTHGRGIYILDDLTPIRALTAETMERDVALLPSRPSEQRVRSSIGSWFNGNDEFVGRNPSDDASIVYWLKKRHLFGDLKVEIYDATGEKIATVPGTKRVGINRVGWATRLKPPKVPPASSLLFGGFEGPRVAEGTYSIKLIKGKTTLDGTVELVADPRNPHSPEDRSLKQKTEMELYREIERLAFVGDSLVAIRDGAEGRAGDAKGGLRKRLDSLAESAEEFRTSFSATGDGYIGGDEKLREKLGTLYGNVLGFEGRPSTTQLERMVQLVAQVDEVQTRFDGFVQGDLTEVNSRLERAGVDPIALPALEEWEKKD